MNHKGAKTIETKHFLIRKFSIKDAKDMYSNWAGNKQDTHYTNWKCHESKTQTEKLIKKWVDKNDKSKQYIWCVENKATGDAIGEILVPHLYKEIETGEITFCFGQSYVEAAGASEALSIIVKFLFQEVQMQRIQTAIDVEAEFEKQVLLASGFKLEGTHRRALKNARGVVDCYSFGIVREDYLRIRQLSCNKVERTTGDVRPGAVPL